MIRSVNHTAFELVTKEQVCAGSLAGANDDVLE